MRDIDLFQLALGLVPPWMTRLDIEIDFKTGGRFACPDAPSQPRLLAAA